LYSFSLACGHEPNATRAATKQRKHLWPTEQTNEAIATTKQIKKAPAAPKQIKKESCDNDTEKTAAVLRQ